MIYSNSSYKIDEVVNICSTIGAFAALTENGEVITDGMSRYGGEVGSILGDKTVLLFQFLKFKKTQSTLNVPVCIVRCLKSEHQIQKVVCVCVGGGGKM